MKLYRNILFVAFVLTLISCGIHAQAQSGFDPAYVKVTNERAQKIVDNMNLVDQDKELRVRDLIAGQYRSLSKIQDGRDAKIEEIIGSVLEKSKQEKKINKLKKEVDKRIVRLHKSYVKMLSKELTEAQIIQVKDGMTYGVVEITYTGYLDMLPNLTEPQKAYIYDNLVEARELAMDGGSSDEKHAWFGKYKGRINNYLSAEGYDLNKASEEWHIRLEERKKNNSN